MKKINFKTLLYGLFSLAIGVLYLSGIVNAEGVVMAMAVPAASTGNWTQQYVSAQGINAREFYPMLERNSVTKALNLSVH